MFWHRVLTVVALGLLGLGLYAHFHTEGTQALAASAHTEGFRRQRRHRPAGPTVLQATAAPEWEDDSVQQAFQVPMPTGQMASLVVEQVWKRLPADAPMQPAPPYLASYVLERDTFHFQNYTTLRLPKGVTQLSRQLYKSLLPQVDAYALQSTRFVGYAAGLFWFEQTLGLPGGPPWEAVYVGLDAQGNILKKGKSGLCDGGVQLSADRTQLLTCQGTLSLTRQVFRSFHAAPTAAVRYLNDSLYLVVEDNASPYRPNARLMHQGGDTLMQFLFHGYQRADRYVAAIAQVDQRLILMDPEVGEVLVWDLKQPEAPKLIPLDKLKAYKTFQEGKRSLSWPFAQWTHCALYLDEQGMPAGYTLE
jgi:hypothetical protein